MADSDPKIPSNMKLNIRQDIASVGSAQTLYFGTHPQHNLSINCDKNGNTMTIDVTTDARLPSNDSSGARISDLSASQINWARVSSGTDDYFSGDSKLITGVKLAGNNTSAVNLTLTQIED